MAKGKTNEVVSVSFHYFEKGIQQDDGEFKTSPFTEAEFTKLTETISTLPIPDLKNVKEFESVKFGRMVPFDICEKIDTRTFFGLFRSAYWGHSFENSKKGKIEADSINLRDFYFLLYHAEDGRIFVGCQYLGNYGAYTTLSKVLMGLIGLGKNLRSSSIYSETEDFQNTVPIEVKINLFSQGKEISDGNVLGSSSIIAFKKQANDTSFELTVKEKILAYFGKGDALIKKQVAALLNENETFSVDDEAIKDCKVIVRKKNGYTKTIYLFGQGERATRFQIDVPLNDDGHPKSQSTKKAMIAKLSEEVISKVQNGQS